MPIYDPYPPPPLLLSIRRHDTHHNDALHNDTQCWVSFMLSVANKPLILSVSYKYIMLNVFMLSVVMLSVVMLKVVAPPIHLRECLAALVPVIS